jgi:hypothetical protein
MTMERRVADVQAKDLQRFLVATSALGLGRVKTLLQGVG